jgi:hypothetical protein
MVALLYWKAAESSQHLTHSAIHPALEQLRGKRKPTQRGQVQPTDKMRKLVRFSKMGVWGGSSPAQRCSWHAEVLAC